MDVGGGGDTAAGGGGPVAGVGGGVVRPCVF